MAVNFLKTLKPVESYYYYFNFKTIKNLCSKIPTLEQLLSSLWLSGYMYFDDFMIRLSLGSKYMIV